MCFYDNTRFICGDWKWGNFRQHCQREYRTGETCGTKMIYQTHNNQEKCQMCQKIERKRRRYEKAKADYGRWASDPDRRASTIKAWEDMNALVQEITQLTQERENKMRSSICNNRRPVAAPSGAYA